MATNIPPHNLTEVVNAAIALVKDPSAGLAEVLKHVLGPDFPTGGFLYGKSGIPQAYKTGRGRFLMRARTALESLTKEKQAIIVTEIPYQVNKSKLIERIAELVNDKIVDDIGDVRDESDRDGMRIVIELKRGAQPEIVLNQLYKHTQMQESFSMIFLAVLNGQPRELGMDQAIRAFIDHRIDVVQRRTVFLLRKAREREHILEGYKIALDNLDTVIRIIRASGSRAEARENLYAWGKGTEIVVTLDRERLTHEERGLTLRQIDAILELQLYRLTQLSIDELLNELKQVREKIAEYESILASESKLRAVIVKELEEVRDKYGDARRTQIVDESAELQLEDLIADEQVAVTVSHQGYLKRTPISIYRQQRRGGAGRMGMKTREEDFVAQLIVNSTHSFLLCFTNAGRMYWLKVYEIPDVGAAGKGKSMQSLLDLQPGENVRAILPVRDLEEEGKFIFFATRNGTVKKTPLKDFSNVMSRGIIAIGIDADDELVKARITDGSQIVFLATHLGMAIRFDEADVRSMGRPAYGVRGISLIKNDFVVGVAITPKEHEPGAYRILSVTENGFGKRTDVEQYRLQARGGKGVKNMAVTPRIGRVNTIQLVDDTSELMVISQFGKIIRIDTKTIRAAGRATQGVRLLNLEPEDKVAAAVIIPPEELNGKDDEPTLLR
jgi:DNA gyrase subunit A